MDTLSSNVFEPPERVKSSAEKWVQRIKDAKKFHKEAYARMRDNIKFVAGLQWNGQTSAHDDRYTVNLTLRMVNQKGAVLYARDPQAEWKRRERLDYVLWGGTQEELLDAAQRLMLDPTDVEASALLSDYEQGYANKKLVERVGKTLTCLHTWNTDHQTPDYKCQMKDLVNRVLICGAAFARVSVVRNAESLVGTTDASKDNLVERAKRAKSLAAQLADGTIDQDSAEAEQLRTLVQSLGYDSSDSEMRERLVFDFPASTSIIPDPKCRRLRGFIGARWVAVEYLLPIEEIIEFFELNGEAVRGSFTQYDAQGQPCEASADKSQPQRGGMAPNAVSEDSLGCVFEVFDSRTKCRLFVLDGYNDYVDPPAPIEPSLRGFYPLFALTFNAAEIEPGLVSVFPLSDVDVLRSVQKEWNRTRDALREHRKANLPKYVTTADLSEEDISRIVNGDPHCVVRLEGVKPGEDITKLIMPLGVKEINPTLYDTSALEQDMLFSVGLQDANMGQPSPKVTATGQTIAEQSRMSTVSSNVDDLDDFNAALSEACGELMLKSFSLQTAKEVAGPGAALPESPDERNYFLHEVYLTVKAASSGRPNKAVEISNFERMAPTLLQSGASPQAVIREAVKRLDEQLDVTEFFPPPMALAPQPQQPALAPPPVEGGQPTLVQNGSQH